MNVRWNRTMPLTENEIFKEFEKKIKDKVEDKV